MDFSSLHSCRVYVECKSRRNKCSASHDKRRKKENMLEVHIHSFYEVHLGETVNTLKINERAKISLISKINFTIN